MKINILKIILSVIIMLILGLSNSLVSASPCTYDHDSDGNVDGNDLVYFMSSGGDYASFALEFGRTDCAPAGTAPTAMDVSISGTPEVGQVLTGHYTYFDAEGDDQGVSTFRWLRDSVEIIGATAQTYTLVNDDLTKSIIFEVTPVAQTGESPGTAVQSVAVGPVTAANTAPTVTGVSISGTAEMGQMLTGHYTYHDADDDPEGTSTFQWLRDGNLIGGATSQTYMLGDDDFGKMIVFEVTPVAVSGESPGTAAQSTGMGPVAPPPGMTIKDYSFSGITSPSPEGSFKAEDGQIAAVSASDIAAGNFGARRDTISGWDNWKEATTEEYAHLTGSDDARYRGADPSNNTNAAMIFELNMNEDPSDLLQIDVTVELSQERARSAAYVYLWNYQTNTYLVGGSYTGSNDGKVSFSVTGNPQDYMDPATGQLTVFVVNGDVSRFSNYYVQVDDIRVRVRSSILPMLTMAENPASAGKTVPELGKHPYDSGTSVNISAMPYAGCSFDSWSGDGVTDPNSASTSVTIGDVDKIVTANYTALPVAFLSDTNFDASAGDEDLIFNSAGQDWYESRQDGTGGPALLSLDNTDVAGHTGKKAKITGSTSLNTYLSQEFGSPQTNTFGVQWDIYVDNIDTSGGDTRSAFMFIGDDIDGQRGPNSSPDDRFVYMAFQNGDDPGTMDLEIYNGGWRDSLIQLNQDQWYTIKVVVDVTANTYNIYVDDLLAGADIPANTPKDNLTHISFASWNDGPGTFYVDNVTQISSLAQVPPCADMPETEAKNHITSDGFVPGATTTELHTDIAAGNVIRTIPAGGTLAPLGTSVNLVVSDGPPPTLPNVVGNDEATAVAIIEDFGGLDLSANVTYAYDPNWAKGLVASQDPAAGAPAFPGTVVDLVVSLGPEPPGLVAETDFETVNDTPDLLTDAPGRDWYESRNDVPSLLFLDEDTIGDHTGKKAGFTGSTSGNAYMSQELKTPQSGVFSIQWDIYVDEILNIDGNPDRSGFMFVGDDSRNGSSSDRNKGPNSTDLERFVYMAFYKDGGGNDGTMDLMAVEPEETTMIAEGLNLKQWYTIKVLCDVPNSTYMVYVNGVFQKAITAYTAKSILTHISFATWNDGAGSFYVDNVMEVPSVLYNLNITPNPNGTVTLGPPGGVYPEGTLVTMTPVPNAGWLFNEWDGDLLGGANPARIVIDKNMEVQPVFIEAPWVAMHVAPTLLDFGSDTSVLTMDVKNNGNVPFDWTATTDQPWVTSINPSASTLEPGQSFNITVTIDRNRIGEALPDSNCRMWGAISTQFNYLPEDLVKSDLDTDPNSIRELTRTYNEEGWGMAYYPEFGDVPNIIRGSVQAYNDPNYIYAVDTVAAATPKVALVHVRNCTQGCCVNLGSDIDDPHPFYRQKEGKTWLFMHNGDINKNSLKNLIGSEYLAANPPNGSGIPLCDPDDDNLVVDSELYFLLVLKNIEANNWSVEKGIIETARLSLMHSSSANFILTDGYTMWALRSGQDLAFYHDASGNSVVASEPPNGSAGWTTMSDNQLVILRPGKAPEVINTSNFYDNKYLATVYVTNSLGENVDVQVTSEGPEGVSVPNVVGMTHTAAEAAITAAGLTLGSMSVDYSVAVPPDTVIYSDPPAGSFVLVGSAVNCVMNLGPVIVDNTDPAPATHYEGTWEVSGGPNPIGVDSWYSNNNGDTFTWYWKPPISTNFDVEEHHTVAGTRTTNARYDIEHDNGEGTKVVTTVYNYNQQINAGLEQWNLLGSFRFEAGVTYAVTLTASGSGSTCADAVRFKKTGVLRHKFTTHLPGGGQIMPVMGDIDHDGDQEIVMAAGGRIIAVNGKTGAIEWSVSGGKDTAVELVDLNNDGTPEILHGMSGPRLRALNGDGTVRWTSAILKGDTQPMFPIIALDIDGNGLPTIWFASEDTDPDPYSGNINDYDGAITMLDNNGHVLRDTWIHHPCWGGMAIANVDHDNEFEIYLGDRREGYHDFPAKGLQAFMARTLQPIWARPDIHHSSPLPILADFNGDGNLELIATKITLAGPMVIDPITGNTISDDSNRNLPTHGTPTVYDIDEDGHLEFITATSYPATAPKNFVVFDLVDKTIDFQENFDFWVTWPPKVGDVTGDGHMEILVATGDQEEEVGDSQNGSYPLIVYDKNYKMIDRVEMPTGTGQLTPARVYDTDGDGYNEVVVPGFNGYLMVYDTDAPTPNPAPRTWVQFYSEYRRGAAEYVPPPTLGN